MKKTLTSLFGIQKNLGPLEEKVMEIVWRRNNSSVREVVKMLQSHHKIAYTTVMTVMAHLYKKGFLNRQKIKKTYHYFPEAPKAVFTRLALSKTIHNLHTKYGKVALFSALFLPSQFIFLPSQINPAISLFKKPISIGFFTTLVLAFLSYSLWDLLYNLQFFGTADYLNLLFSEPKIILSQGSLIFLAFWESLPIINLSTSLILCLVAVLLTKKLVKVLEFKIPIGRLA